MRKSAQLTSILLLILTLVTASACGGQDAKGTIVGREHTPAHSELEFVGCGIGFDGKYRCGAGKPRLVNYSDKYHITILQCDGNVTRIKVSEEAFFNSTEFWSDGPARTNPC